MLEDLALKALKVVVVLVEVEVAELERRVDIVLGGERSNASFAGETLVEDLLAGR